MNDRELRYEPLDPGNPTPDTAPGSGEPHAPLHRLIRASAGSGKTYRLTVRYLWLLARGEDPGAILATTFTRKAAGEILGRVLGRLARAAADPAAAAELASAVHDEGPLPGTPADLGPRAWVELLVRLTAQLHRLGVSTIDSFFTRIAQCFALELDLPPEPVLADPTHPVIRQLRAQAIDAMLADFTEDDKEFRSLLTLLRQLHHDTARRSVTEAIHRIVEDFHAVYRETPDPAAWRRIQVKGLLEGEKLAAAINALAQLKPELPRNKDGTPPKRWEAALDEGIEAACAGDWEGFVAKGLAPKVASGAETFDRKPIPAAFAEVYAPLVAHVAATQAQLVKLQTEATHALLARFDRHAERLARRERVLSFDDLTHRLAHVLPEADPEVLADVYFRLDGRVTHLLLDEFQDTSLAQWAVLGPMAEELLAHGPGGEGGAAGRTFFCVGDEKQAIYAWRGGERALFDAVQDAVGPRATQTLAKSYRSSPVVLEAVNRVFGRLTDAPPIADHPIAPDAAKRWSRGFEPHDSAKPDLPGYVTLQTTPAPPDSPEPKRPADQDDDGAPGRRDPEPDPGDPEADQPAAPDPHAAAAAKWVQRLLHDDPAATVGVLCRTNKAVHRVLFELRRLGIDASGEGGSPLADSPPVAAVLSALRLADHPGDTAAAFHVLNGPLGKIVGLTGLDAAARVAAAQRIRHQAAALGFAELVARWARAVAGDCDARGVARLAQLVELAEGFEPASPLRPAQFAHYAAAQRVEQPEPAMARVMTIHAAKGLEFDAVVLPDLDKPPRLYAPILLDRPDPVGPVRGVYRNAEGKVRALIEPMPELHHRWAVDALAEAYSNLYVAMTRPRRRLVLLVRPPIFKKNGETEKPGTRDLSPAALLRATLSEFDPAEENPAGGMPLAEFGDPPAPLPDAPDTPEADAPTPAAQAASPVAKPASASAPTPPHSPAPRRAWPSVSPSAAGGAEVTGADLLAAFGRPGGGAARQWGTLIHHLLMAVGFADEPGGAPGDDAWRAHARTLVPAPDPAMLERALPVLRAWLSQPAVRHRLGRRGAAELWRERGFAARDAGRLARGRFDRVALWRDDAGRPVRAELVDYKTDRLTARGNAAQAALVSAHGEQLRAYRRALAAMLGLDPARVGAWIVQAPRGVVVEVPPEAGA